MKKNGFTLTEILAVLALISALAIIAIPSILNYINNSKNEVSDVTEKIIFTGADLYIDKNKENFEDNKIKRYCIVLRDIVNQGFLEAPIMDSVSGKEIDLNKFVKATVEYDNDLKQYKFNYEITNECKQEKFTCVGAVANEIATGNISEGNLKPGDEYICEVKDGTKYNFFVLSTEEDKINLIMDSNVTRDGKPIKSTDVIEAYSSEQWNMWRTPWYTNETYNWDNSKNSNNNGPITALEYLEEATRDWDNVPDFNYIHTDEGELYPTINKTLKARMPERSEIDNLFIDKNYNMDNFRLDMLPIWVTNYLYNNSDSLNYNEGSYVEGRTHIDHLGTYWLMDSVNAVDQDAAYEVGFDSGRAGQSVVWPFVQDDVGTSLDLWGGVRPVISITRNDLIN